MARALVVPETILVASGGSGRGRGNALRVVDHAVNVHFRVRLSGCRAGNW